MEIIVYYPVTLPADISNRLETIVQNPSTAAVRTCELIEQLGFRYSEAEFFRYAGTIAQSLPPDTCDDFRREVHRALRDESDSLSEQVRFLYAIL